MTDVIRGTATCPAAPATVDDYLRTATGARSDVSATFHAEGHDPAHGIHVAVDAAAASATIADEVPGLFGATLAGMTLDIAAAWGTWAMGPIEGERRGREWDAEMMRGCLAAFEGRTDDPEVREHIAASPAFANGVRDAERIAIRNPALFACMHAAVVAANDAGADAVYAGTDTSATSSARYESDLAYRHGVDEARALRERDPAAYEAARRERTALTETVDMARTGAPVRG